MGRSKDIATSAKGDADYVNVSGDTMTGALTLNNDIIANKHLRLYTTDDQANQWYVYNNTDDTLRFNYNGAGNDEVVLDTVGRMKIPNQPGWHGTHSDAYSSTYSAGQAHSMDSSLERYNVGNHFNYSNNRFTCPVTGYYLLYGWDICIDSSSVYNSGNAIGCWKNAYSGANRLVSIYRQYNRGYSFTGTAYLAANDYVTFGNSEGSIGAGAYYGSLSYSGYGIRLIA